MLGQSENAGMARIERGKIVDKKRDSARNQMLYRVESLTRDGIPSRWMEALLSQGTMPEYADDAPYNPFNIGDAVYYFMFEDGRGLVLARARFDLD